MVLSTLSLLNYKNFDSQNFNFNSKLNCFVGANGIGKTNILDAIYHLSFSKSYFNPISTQNIKHDEDFFVIEGQYNKHKKEERIVVSLKRGQKKVIKRNGKPYEKFSDHVGFLPLVIISPADSDLIIEGSTVRRRFIDSVISQSNSAYLQNLIKYNKVLQQRNALLKYFALNHTYNQDTISIYNAQMDSLADFIFKERKQFLETFIPIFKTRYNRISSNRESVHISYKSDLNESRLQPLLEATIAKDKALQYTSVGIHKDDLLFKLNKHPIKKYGSQGQQKSFLISLKLAQFDFIKAESKVTPLLLLDDIFDKLDESRVAQIINLVNDAHFGQIFLSDTHAERTENVVKQTNQAFEIFHL